MSDLLLSLGFFFSALMQGMTGFGSAIGMNAFLTKVIDIKVVTPVVMALTLLLNITMLSRQNRLSHFPQLKQLIGWSVVGIPFGYLLLKTIPHHQAMYIIAGLIFGLLCLELRTEKQNIEIKGGGLDAICFLAGAFGLAYNVTGIFIALYVLSINLEKTRSLHLTATYFMIINIIGISLLWRQGFYTAQVFHYIFLATPYVIFGAFGGMRISRYITQQRYTRMVRGFLLLSLTTIML